LSSFYYMFAYHKLVNYWGITPDEERKYDIHCVSYKPQQFHPLFFRRTSGKHLY